MQDAIDEIIELIRVIDKFPQYPLESTRGHLYGILERYSERLMDEKCSDCEGSI